MFKVYDDVRVEPTDVSFKAAADFAKANKFDAILAVGGGSVIDTGMIIQETVPLYRQFFIYVFKGNFNDFFRD